MKQSKFLTEFKEFAMRGNVVDMAVGIVIGGAFGKIISSFVGDILMPVLGLVTGGVDFSQMRWVMKDEVLDAAGEVVTPAVSMNYGMLVQNVFDFVIVAFCIFCVIKFMNNLKKKEEAAPAEPAKPSEEVQLLTDIKELLKNQNKEYTLKSAASVRA